MMLLSAPYSVRKADGIYNWSTTLFGQQTLPERLLGIGSTQDPLGICSKELLDLLRNVGTGGCLFVDARIGQLVH